MNLIKSLSFPCKPLRHHLSCQIHHASCIIHIRHHVSCIMHHNGEKLILKTVPGPSLHNLMIFTNTHTCPPPNIPTECCPDINTRFWPEKLPELPSLSLTWSNLHNYSPIIWNSQIPTFSWHLQLLQWDQISSTLDY